MNPFKFINFMKNQKKKETLIFKGKYIMTKQIMMVRRDGSAKNVIFVPQQLH